MGVLRWELDDQGRGFSSWASAQPHGFTLSGADANSTQWLGQLLKLCYHLPSPFGCSCLLWVFSPHFMFLNSREMCLVSRKEHPNTNDRGAGAVWRLQSPLIQHFLCDELPQKQSVENITAFRSKIRNHSADWFPPPPLLSDPGNSPAVMFP